MGPPFRLVCSLSLLVAVAGCSNLKTYPNTADKNLQVQTKLSGSFLTGVEAFLHIHRLKDSCSGDYLGTVELKNGLTQVGIAPGQPTYLAFAFNTSARLGGSFGTTSYTTISGLAAHLDASSNVGRGTAQKRNEPVSLRMNLRTAKLFSPSWFSVCAVSDAAVWVPDGPQWGR